MERYLSLVPESLMACRKVVFMLPKSGNDDEYMTIEKGQPGFDSLIREGVRVATKIKEKERAAHEKKQKDADYKKFIELKAMFEPDSPF